MRTVNIHEAKTDLSRQVEDAAQGDEIVIAETGTLVPLVTPERRVPKFGTMKDKIWVADDWDSPETNEAIWAEFWENIDKEP
jgi:antitoxin (DNA-binding transcriptional repressor) of toxin-antitoxin stability system